MQEENTEDDILEEDLSDVLEKTEWEKLLEKSEDEKREIYKELARYSRSPEFAKVKEFAKAKEDGIVSDIERKIKERFPLSEERKPCASKLDMYLIMIELTKEIIPLVNTTLGLFLEDRNERLMSAVRNKMEEWFDIQIYSEIDVLKQSISVFHSVSWYLDTCMNYFDTKQKEEPTESSSAY